METSAISWGDTTIPYAIQRSAKRQTVSLAIDREVGVVVTAPALTPIVRLDDVVRTKAPWIVEKLRRQSDRPPRPPGKEFLSGETFSYLGKQYRLRLERGPGVAPMRLTGGWLYLPVPGDLSPTDESAYARAALVDWYTRRAREAITPRVGRWARKIGAAPAKVLISAPGRRWASASVDGTLRFNWRIVQASPALVDYVIAHELAHLVHHDHSAAFWSVLARVMPDYEAVRVRLRTVGPELEW
ncbi:MAG: hypothetical protein JWP97_6209 [Labilithrix sp.]|nr:hypothetical protein [Labilithrix sp.]